jgi:hypothetical protein
MASVRLLLMVALRSTTPGKGKASERPQVHPHHPGQNFEDLCKVPVTQVSVFNTGAKVTETDSVYGTTGVVLTSTCRNARALESLLDLI